MRSVLGQCVHRGCMWEGEVLGTQEATLESDTQQARRAEPQRRRPARDGGCHLFGAVSVFVTGTASDSLEFARKAELTSQSWYVLPLSPSLCLTLTEAQGHISTQWVF